MKAILLLVPPTLDQMFYYFAAMNLMLVVVVPIQSIKMLLRRINVIMVRSYSPDNEKPSDIAFLIYNRFLKLINTQELMHT